MDGIIRLHWIYSAVCVDALLQLYKDTPMPASIGLVVDIETTGLSDRDEIIEISLIAFEYDSLSGVILKRLDEYTGLREPSVACDNVALQAHGISPGMTRGRSLDKKRIFELISIAEIIFSHNVEFDRKFLQKQYADLSNKHWACTMRQILWDWEGFFGIGLSAIAEHYGIEQGIIHRARNDAEVVLKILEKPNCLGIPHIRQLHERLYRKPFILKFRNRATKRPLKINASSQDDEVLARSTIGDSLKLWTKDGHDFINAYVRGSIGGKGRALQFVKSANKTLLTMMSPENRGELVVSRRTESSIELDVIS